jgi:hypothetical protein
MTSFKKLVTVTVLPMTTFVAAFGAAFLALSLIS